MASRSHCVALGDGEPGYHGALERKRAEVQAFQNQQYHRQHQQQRVCRAVAAQMLEPSV